VTDRKTLDQMISDDLDQLHAENDRLEAELGDYETRVEQLTTELAALRQVARGYCPHCGRGDAAPTTADWERERQRADQVEELLRIAHETSNTSEAERARAVQRAERAEEQLALHEQQLHHLDDACMAARNELTDAQAAIRRVLDFAADIERSGWTGPAIARRIRETLGQTAAGHTATQTTDNPAEPR
jgi:chromosome segregation ATPase